MPDSLRSEKKPVMCTECSVLNYFLKEKEKKSVLPPADIQGENLFVFPERLSRFSLSDFTRHRRTHGNRLHGTKLGRKTNKFLLLQPNVLLIELNILLL